MNLPIILFGTTLAILYGAAYHLWKGGSLLRLVSFLALSLIGFWVGHLAGTALHISFASIGVLDTGMATLGSLVFLFAGDWLSLVNIQRK